MNRLRFALTILLVVAAAMTITACGDTDDDSSDTPPGVLIGVQDDRLQHPTEPVVERFDKVQSVGAKFVRVDLRWDNVAELPPGDPTNPDDPAYNWEHYDNVVDEARKRDITVLMTIWGTPAWARDTSEEAADMANYAWAPYAARPADPANVGKFAEAAAKRYAPKGVKMWESWNEPNIPMFLRPQYRREGDRLVPESPRTFAAIHKGVYEGIKRVDPSARVAGGVTAPVGTATPGDCAGLPENCRITPHDFIKALNDPELRPQMDAYAHHPYPLRTPTNTNNPNANYIDLYSQSVLEEKLDETYLKGTPVWLTEFGVATRPTDNLPFSRPPAVQREMLIDAVDRVRKNPRIEAFVWYYLQDGPQWASGLLTLDGQPKPAAEAMKEILAED